MAAGVSPGNCDKPEQRNLTIVGVASRAQKCLDKHMTVIYARDTQTVAGIE